VLGGLITLAGALTFSEAAALLPEAGGQYVYLTHAYGGLVGFLFGWAYFVVVNAGGLGALAVAFATYLGFFIPLGPAASKTVAIVSPIVLSSVNVVGEGRRDVLNVFTGAELLEARGSWAVGLAPVPCTTDFSLHRPRAGRGAWRWRSAWSGCSGLTTAGSTPRMRAPRSRTLADAAPGDEPGRGGGDDDLPAG
jgi:APA family basic amino acid/polyamine antiporter